MDKISLYAFIPLAIALVYLVAGHLRLNVDRMKIARARKAPGTADYTAIFVACSCGLLIAVNLASDQFSRVFFNHTQKSLLVLAFDCFFVVVFLAALCGVGIGALFSLVNIAESLKKPEDGPEEKGS